MEQPDKAARVRVAKINFCKRTRSSDFFVGECSNGVNPQRLERFDKFPNTSALRSFERNASLTVEVEGGTKTAPSKNLRAFNHSTPRHVEVGRKYFFGEISYGHGQFFERASPSQNHHPCRAVYIVLPVSRCSRATGRTSTAAVAGQPVLWDSLETPDWVAKLAP
ncbi:hypothetical protein [Paraburkholderia phytofirmans]|uniref:Uncharacterized protein n=1 Tax=Paraburkholderia phytofirmans TaxID=261302 RepID=A0ABW9BJV6_9BURK